MTLIFKLKEIKFALFLILLIFLRIHFLGVGDSSSYVSDLSKKNIQQIQLSNLSQLLNKLKTLQKDMYSKYLNYFPSPHSELLAGMVLGLDNLKSNPTFNDVLIQTGTVHVVVVSGFNIVIFFDFLQRIFGSMLKLKNFLTAEIVSLIYAVFTGFEYPVIRAWLMSSFVYTAKFLGIKSSSMYILTISALFMTIFQPLAITDMSFQLSFLAVLGLSVFSVPLTSLAKKYLNKFADKFYVKDFISSLSAQMFVWPLISYNIGTFNFVSPFTNAFLLWSIPYATAFGMLFSVLYKFDVVLKFLSLFIYPFLDFFVEGSLYLSEILPSQLKFSISPLWAGFYYLFMFSFLYFFRYKK